jgi:simple sugar transport system permease protein
MNNRSEADRLGESGWFSSLVKRPEIGPLGVMLLLFGMLGYFSIPAGEFSFNPFCWRWF